MLFIHMKSNTVRGDLEEVKSDYTVLGAKVMGRRLQEVLILQVNRQGFVRRGCILKVINWQWLVLHAGLWLFLTCSCAMV